MPVWRLVSPSQELDPWGDRPPPPGQAGRWHWWLERVPRRTRGGLWSRRRRCHHIARAAGDGGQRAVVPFSWCFSSCYETGHFPVHL